MIICDEFQDTDDRQYALLLAIKGDARLLLMGDPNQCIYANLPGDRSETRALVRRPRSTRRKANRSPRGLAPRSDGVIPALAAAIRRREFDSPAIDVAMESERLQVWWTADTSQEAEGVAKTIESLQEQGLSVAVFSHHNDALAALSDQLRELNVDHEITGLSESLVSALEAQLNMIRLRRWRVRLDGCPSCLSHFRN